jgi:lipopolysaccharide transport system ATP-binding protein
MDTSRRWDEPPPPGDYVCTAWIPGNFLNEGLMTVLTQICSIDVMTLRPHASGGNVAFHVQDPGEGDSARGRFAGQWKGVVRPLLDWTTEQS